MYQLVEEGRQSLPLHGDLVKSVFSQPLLWCQLALGLLQRFAADAEVQIPELHLICAGAAGCAQAGDGTGPVPDRESGFGLQPNRMRSRPISTSWVLSMYELTTAPSYAGCEGGEGVVYSLGGKGGGVPEDVFLCSTAVIGNLHLVRGYGA